MVSVERRRRKKHKGNMIFYVTVLASIVFVLTAIGF
jgi:hypothetical protein